MSSHCHWGCCDEPGPPCGECRCCHVQSSSDLKSVRDYYHNWLTKNEEIEKLLCVGAVFQTKYNDCAVIARPGEWGDKSVDILENPKSRAYPERVHTRWIKNEVHEIDFITLGDQKSGHDVEKYLPSSGT